MAETTLNVAPERVEGLQNNVIASNVELQLNYKYKQGYNKETDTYFDEYNIKGGSIHVDAITRSDETSIVTNLNDTWDITVENEEKILEGELVCHAIEFNSFPNKNQLILIVN